MVVLLDPHPLGNTLLVNSLFLGLYLSGVIFARFGMEIVSTGATLGGLFNPIVVQVFQCRRDDGDYPELIGEIEARRCVKKRGSSLKPIRHAT